MSYTIVCHKVFVILKKKALALIKEGPAFPVKTCSLSLMFIRQQGNIYILFDGFTYNTRGYFASCVVFFRAAKGRGKYEQ